MDKKRNTSSAHKNSNIKLLGLVAAVGVFLTIMAWILTISSFSFGSASSPYEEFSLVLFIAWTSLAVSVMLFIMSKKKMTIVVALVLLVNGFNILAVHLGDIIRLGQ